MKPEQSEIARLKARGRQAEDRTRRVWHDMLVEDVSCGLHRIERLMGLQALKARPRRRRLPPDLGKRQVAAVAPNVLARSFEASAPNRKWIADFTYVWTAEGWLYVAAVVDLFSRRVVGWSMNAAMTAPARHRRPGDGNLAGQT
jgi:putative transposase